MNKQQTVIVLDLGVPQSQQAVRRIRDLGVYCEIIPFDTPISVIKAKTPIALVIIGNEQAAATVQNNEVLGLGLPVLTIGLRLDAANITNSDILPQNINTDESKSTLKDFLYNKSGATGDWTTANFVKNMIEIIRNKVGDKKVLCAMSGGVDSAVAATLVYKAVGKQLTSMLVDHGLMRKNEAAQVVSVFRDGLGMNLIKIDAQDRFLGKLAGITDPETKRKTIGAEFIRVFEEEGRKLGKMNFLVQGTIYPDVIESGIGGAVIKSHHNVGGLPSVIDFDEIIEPLRELYKDEVRQVGLELGLSKDIVMRQPFPGPGLGIRVIGEITKEKLDILRDADAIFREEIALNNLTGDIWQYFAVLTSMRSVGMKDELRTYDYTLALRAITSIDAMTADWAKIPYPILAKISSRITSEVNGINRIVYDITSKPPATIEWE